MKSVIAILIAVLFFAACGDGLPEYKKAPIVFNLELDRIGMHIDEIKKADKKEFPPKERHLGYMHYYYSKRISGRLVTAEYITDNDRVVVIKYDIGDTIISDGEFIDTIDALRSQFISQFGAQKEDKYIDFKSQVADKLENDVFNIKMSWNASDKVKVNLIAAYLPGGKVKNPRFVFVQIIKINAHPISNE